MQEPHRAGAARLLAGLLQEGERHGGLDLVRVVRHLQRGAQAPNAERLLRTGVVVLEGQRRAHLAIRQPFFQLVCLFHLLSAILSFARRSRSRRKSWGVLLPERSSAVVRLNQT